MHQFDKLLVWLGPAYFLMLDLAKRYWQISLSKESKETNCVLNGL